MPGGGGNKLEQQSRDANAFYDNIGRWATKNGAELLGTRTGAIAAGKLADLIVVEGRPHEDIAALATTETIRLIMLGGKAAKNTLAERGVNLGRMAAQ